MRYNIYNSYLCNKDSETQIDLLRHNLSLDEAEKYIRTWINDNYSCCWQFCQDLIIVKNNATGKEQKINVNKRYKAIKINV